LTSLACGIFFSIFFLACCALFPLKSSSESFWDAFHLSFLNLSTNSLVVTMIQEKRLGEAFLLTQFESLGVIETVGSKELG